jgi:hypothetical protein
MEMPLRYALSTATHLWISALLMSWTSIGHAQQRVVPTTRIERSSFEQASTVSEVGGFLPWSRIATTGAARALISTQAAYETAGAALRSEARGELSLSRRVRGRDWRLGASLFGGVSDVAADSAARLRGHAGLKLQFLEQSQYGVDLSLAESYVSRAFNLQPAIVSELLVARRLRALAVLLNLAYGQGLAEQERFARCNAALLAELAPALLLGLDTQISTDLERDGDEPVGEPQRELLATPVVTYSWKQLAFKAYAGASWLRYRFADRDVRGALVGIGVGTAI